MNKQFVLRIRKCFSLHVECRW